jgi:selenocysteine lyase/cysteine desulfurase
VNRERFPGLRDGWARFDAPAGAQPVDAAIDAMAEFMRSGAVANGHGLFEAAERLDAMVAEAREVAGAFVGGDPRGLVFGPSMTTLTLAFSAAVGRTLSPGDEIVCTRLDHDGDVAPWLIAAERAGALVRFAEPEAETLDLPASAVEAVLSDRTRWVAVTAASNAVGSVPELGTIVSAAHAAGARVYVDAVHAAPHRELDVSALGCDALVCSAYKWFGPHQSILWARPELLEELRPDKLRPSPDSVPDRLRAIAGVTVYGSARDRVPTLMFSVAGRTPEQVAKALSAERVAVWHGNYYALELSTLLGLEPDGALRAGVVHYNDDEDVDRLLSAVERVAG